MATHTAPQSAEESKAGEEESKEGDCVAKCGRTSAYIQRFNRSGPRAMAPAGPSKHSADYPKYHRKSKINFEKDTDALINGFNIWNCLWTSSAYCQL